MTMFQAGRRFDDKVYRRNARLWSWFDVPGGVWLTLFSGALFVMWIALFVHNLHVLAAERMEMPSGITPTYIAILTNFAASNIARWYKDRQCSHSTDSPQGVSPSLVS